MGSAAGFVVGDVVGFVAAWVVIGCVVWFGYEQACRVADRRRERELRRLLGLAGRQARRSVDEAWPETVRLAQIIIDAKALTRILRDIRRTDPRPPVASRPPLVAVPDPPERLREVV